MHLLITPMVKLRQFLKCVDLLKATDVSCRIHAEKVWFCCGHNVFGGGVGGEDEWTHV